MSSSAQTVRRTTQGLKVLKHVFINHVPWNLRKRENPRTVAKIVHESPNNTQKTREATRNDVVNTQLKDQKHAKPINVLLFFSTRNTKMRRTREGFALLLQFYDARSSTMLESSYVWQGVSGWRVPLEESLTVGGTDIAPSRCRFDDKLRQLWFQRGGCSAHVLKTQREKHHGQIGRMHCWCVEHVSRRRRWVRSCVIDTNEVAYGLSGVVRVDLPNCKNAVVVVIEDLHWWWTWFAWLDDWCERPTPFASRREGASQLSLSCVREDAKQAQRVTLVSIPECLEEEAALTRWRSRTRQSVKILQHWSLFAGTLREDCFCVRAFLWWMLVKRVLLTKDSKMTVWNSVVLGCVRVLLDCWDLPRRTTRQDTTRQTRQVALYDPVTQRHFLLYSTAASISRLTQMRTHIRPHPCPVRMMMWNLDDVTSNHDARVTNLWSVKMENDTRNYDTFWWKTRRGKTDHWQKCDDEYFEASSMKKRNTVCIPDDWYWWQIDNKHRRNHSDASLLLMKSPKNDYRTHCSWGDCMYYDLADLHIFVLSEFFSTHHVSQSSPSKSWLGHLHSAPHIFHDQHENNVVFERTYVSDDPVVLLNAPWTWRFPRLGKFWVPALRYDPTVSEESYNPLFR